MRPLIDLSIVPMEDEYDEKDFAIVSMRLNDGLTLPVIAAKFGISTDRIRQRYARSTRHIAYPWRMRTFDYRRLLHPTVMRCYRDLVFRYHAEFGEDWYAYDKAIAAKHLPGIKEWRVIDLMQLARRVNTTAVRDEAEATNVHGRVMPVTDKFSFPVQEWTPETQYHETRIELGTIE